MMILNIKLKIVVKHSNYSYSFVNLHSMNVTYDWTSRHKINNLE